MADKYRMTPHSSGFIVNYNAGGTVGVFKTRQEAKQNIVDCEREDLVLKTARRLVNKAVGTLMRIYRLDRRAACGWIREAAD